MHSGARLLGLGMPVGDIDLGGRMHEWLCFVLGAAGAAAFELIRFYELMGKLPARRLRQVISSRLNISITMGLVVASGFIAWAINANTDVTPWQLVVTGIGARTLVAKPLELTKLPTPTLGPSEHPTDSGARSGVLLKDLFP